MGQWDWLSWEGFAGLLSVAVNAIGLVFIYKSLQASQASAKASADAVEAAAKSLLATTRLERGALAMTITEGNDGDEYGDWIAVEFENPGRTLVVVDEWNFYSRGKDDPLLKDYWDGRVAIPIENFRGPPKRGLIVPPGKSWTVGRFPWSPGAALVGGVVYKDVFDDFHLVEICLKLSRGHAYPSQVADFSLWEEKLRKHQIQESKTNSG